MLDSLKSFAKRMLAIRSVRTTYEITNRAFLESFGSSRVLTHLFYVVSFLTFNREQSAVLRGRRDYYRNKSSYRTTHVELRRNVHRLEKGLIMQPRRPVFAKDYIEETVEFYVTAAEQTVRRPGTIETAEMDWAYNVLAEFFAVVDDADPVIARAKAEFVAHPYTPVESDTVPYPKRQLSDVTYDQMTALAHQRRSVRWFDGRPAPREAIDQALLVARQAPTACNRLPYEFLVFDDPDMVRTVSGIPFGTAGYGHNIPTIVVVVGKLESYFSPRDRHAPYVDASLASMSFMFALETLGLSSSVINWPDFEPLEQKMQSTLGLGMSDRVIMLIAVGYADPNGKVPYSQKKDLDTFRRYNALPQ